MKFLFASAALLLAGAATLAGGAMAADKINALAVIVNNDGITRLEIARLAEELMRQSDAADGELTEAAARRQAADSLIFRHLQLQRARRLGVEIPPEMAEQRLAALRERFNAPDNDALRAAVRDNLGVSWEDFYARILEDLEIEAVFYREVFGETDVYEKDVEEFLKNESVLFGEREYRLRHLRIDRESANARAVAEDLRRRLLADGGTFPALARAHSSAADAQQDGDMGWRTAARLPAAFVSVVLEMEMDDISEIIETPRGYHLLQLLGVRGGGAGESMSQIHLSHIFLELDETELADDLYARLSAEEDFSALVRRYSRDDRSAETGGAIGWFPITGLPDYFAPAKDAKAGEILPPVTSEFGLHIVRVDRRNEIRMDDAREMARDILRERRALAQRREWLEKLRSRAYIIVVDPEFGDLNDGGG